MGATTAGLRVQTAGGIGTGLSDLDPSLEDLRGGGDIDLFSLVDSTETTQRSAETDGVLLELSTLAPASEYPRVEPVPAPSESAASLPGIQGHQDDSASSDLLSSQWQMDSGLWDETATKLDLARAYLEMGDKESAKGILEEVGNEGNEDQRTEALELLRRLA
jgi:pilus assembly protein FimV